MSYVTPDTLSSERARVAGARGVLDRLRRSLAAAWHCALEAARGLRAARRSTRGR